MARISLKRLEINNFRSLKGKHTIVFPDKGLVQVKGSNLDTGGQSAAGKSNVLLAISYLFDFCPHPAAALQNWDTEEPMQVVGYLATEKGEVAITRAAGHISISGAVECSGSAKAVHKAVDVLCGVPAELREILSYRDQRAPRKFLSMKDVEKKEFLVQVLPELGKIEKEIELRSKAVSGLEKDVLAKEQVYAMLRQELDAYPSPQEPILENTALIDDELSLEKESGSVLNITKTGLEALIAVKRGDIKAKAHTVKTLFDNRFAALEDELNQIRLTPVHINMDGPNALIPSIAECETYLKHAQKAVDDSKEVFDAETKVINQKITKVEIAFSKEKEVDREIAVLEKENITLADNSCPTCSQQWKDAAAKIQENNNRLQILAVDKLTFKDIPDILFDLYAKLETRTFTPDPKLESLKRVRAQLQEGYEAAERDVKQSKLDQESNIKQMVAEKNLEISRVRAELSKALLEVETEQRSDIDSLVIELSGITGQLEESRKNEASWELKLQTIVSSNKAEMVAFKSALDALSRAQGRVVAAKELLDVAQNLLNQELDYLDLVKGFKNKIFDELLGAIGLEATEILGHLPNASSISIEFRSEYETQAGTVKSSIKPVIFMNGTERELNSSASGGQMTSIELAVDLAIISVVSKRLGTDLAFLILDECFSGHDGITKGSCLEMLASYASDKLVLIVDHTNEIKGMFQKTIEVELKDGVSRIKNEVD